MWSSWRSADTEIQQFIAAGRRAKMYGVDFGCLFCQERERVSFYCLIPCLNWNPNSQNILFPFLSKSKKSSLILQLIVFLAKFFLSFFFTIYNTVLSKYLVYVMQVGKRWLHLIKSSLKIWRNTSLYLKKIQTLYAI